ncbi:MAG: GerMN domain-containing protein [Clostridium sp.]
MNKKLFIFISSVAAVLFSLGIIYLTSYPYQSLQVGRPFTPKKDDIQVGSVNNSINSKAPFIVYRESSSSKLLKPEVIHVNSDGDIYTNIVNSIIESSQELSKRKTKLSSVERKSNIIRVNLSNNIKKDLATDENTVSLWVMAIVNSLTEINGIDKVEIYSGKDKVSIGGIDTFKRDHKIIEIEVFDSPKKVLAQQMKLEQEGDFLRAYMLMSHIHTNNRKMYYEYFKEMSEIRSLGFLGSSFNIKDTTINKGEAIVNVEFVTKFRSGESGGSSILPIRCIYINGGWVVDWEGL